MLAIVEKTPDKIKAVTGFEPSSQIQAQPPTDRPSYEATRWERDTLETVPLYRRES